MAGKNITIAGATFNGVPSIDVPVSGGGTASFVEISDTTAQAADVASGKYFYTAAGVKTEGTASGGGGVTVESLSVTQNGTYTAPTGKAYSPVTVNVSGGGVERKDVNFFDYDGTLLYSYTAQEAAALDALPANPSHTGLTAKGWNWTLAQMKAQINATGTCDIGQMYTTSDGKTRIYITIEDGTPSGQMTFYLRLTAHGSGAVTIDWGDGNTTVSDSTSAKNYSHTYSAVGDYVITLTISSAKASFIGSSGSSGNSIFGSRASSNAQNNSRIRHIFFGENVTAIGTYIFHSCKGLETVILPYYLTQVSSYFFYSCYALKCIIVPSSVTAMNFTYFTQNCYNLGVVSLSPNATTFDYYTLYGAASLREVTIPTGTTAITQAMFGGCTCLQELTIPSSVTSIAGSAFTTLYGIKKFRFKSTTPPTAAQGCFPSRQDLIIVVPEGTVDTYKGTSNYPTATSIIWQEE